MDKKDNQLSIIAQQQGLQPSKIDSLMHSFAAYFNEAKKLSEAARSIVVTDETQTDLMLKARESRLTLKSLRVKVVQVHDSLKEQSLREGRAIDGVANLIKALIVPVEEHLERQEKYGELKQLERIQKKYEERISRLTPYVDDITLYAVKDMSDVAFENLFAGCKKNFEDRKAAEAKVEADRIAKEKADAEENERIRKENEKLKKEAEEKAEKQAEADRIAEEKLAAAKKAKEDAEEKLRKEKEAQLEKERKIKEAEDAKKAAEEERRRKALLAPDKEKLLEWANQIETKLTAPAVESHEAAEIVRATISALDLIASKLREGAKTL
jgi:DNA repair exonuclease SbcCD ATPase subunit